MIGINWEFTFASVFLQLKRDLAGVCGPSGFIVCICCHLIGFSEFSQIDHFSSPRSPVHVMDILLPKWHLNIPVFGTTNHLVTKLANCSASFSFLAEN